MLCKKCDNLIDTEANQIYKSSILKNLLLLFITMFSPVTLCITIIIILYRIVTCYAVIEEKFCIFKLDLPGEIYLECLKCKEKIVRMKHNGDFPLLLIIFLVFAVLPYSILWMYFT